jgi:hypothetical protein
MHRLAAFAFTEPFRVLNCRTSYVIKCNKDSHMNVTMLLGAYCMLVSCVAYALSLKLKATCVPETSVFCVRTVLCYVSEDENADVQYSK